MSNLEDAQREITTLFEIMSIQKVVCVDDYYDITSKKTGQLVVPLIKEPSTIADIPEFQQIDFDDEVTYLLEEIEQILSNVSQSRLQEIYQQLHERQPKDSDYVSVISYSPKCGE